MLTMARGSKLRLHGWNTDDNVTVAIIVNGLQTNSDNNNSSIEPAFEDKITQSFMLLMSLSLNKLSVQ